MAERVATLESLVVSLPSSSIRGDSSTRISGISFDSRSVQPGDLFAALVGHDFNGHDFVDDAARRGAGALLVEQESSLPLPQIVVPDSRAALAGIAAEFFGHPSREVAVIGVTGTDGKTTTSYLIDHILRTNGLRTGLVGTVAIRVGDHEELHPSRQTTPESSEIQRLLRSMVDACTDWAIVEVTSHGLAMHRLDHVAFRIGAVTNITHEHLDFHGSLDNYRRAKAMLLERVAETAGVVVVNADDEGARSVAPFAIGADVLWFSTTGRDADLKVTDIVARPTGSEFTLNAGSWGRESVRLPMLGEFNIANAVCAAGVALAAGVDLANVARALRSAPAVPGRMARVDMGQPFSVVVDYAHTPESLEKVLALLRRLHGSGRLIVVFGSAGERDVAKRPLQGAVAARLADVVVVTSEDPRNEDPDAIIEDIAAAAEEAGAVPGRTLFRRTDRREAIRVAVWEARPGDCVLLAGKGHEASIIWGWEKLPWDEAGVARELLQEAGYSGSGEGEALR